MSTFERLNTGEAGEIARRVRDAVRAGGKKLVWMEDDYVSCMCAADSYIAAHRMRWWPDSVVGVYGPGVEHKCIIADVYETKRSYVGIGRIRMKRGG